mmetsp:Transcript_113976/g.302931  ORF Transcript_113976/g.302931 Transcript_113976/m.302931 type:complete len:231 (-) Transcript_113976:616-1308(-)
MLCSKRSVGTGIDGFASESSSSSEAPKCCRFEARGVSAWGGGGQPGSALRVAACRNSSHISWPAPGRSASRTCALFAVCTRPAKSVRAVTSPSRPRTAGLASSSLRSVQLFTDWCSCCSRTGCPDMAISLSVCACRARKSVRMSERRSCSMCFQTIFQVSSFCTREAILRTASRSRSRTFAVRTFFNSFSGFSSMPPSNVSWMLWTWRCACLWGAQEVACSRFTRSSFLW